MNHVVLVVVAVVAALLLSVAPTTATPIAAVLLGLCTIAAGLASPSQTGPMSRSER